MKQFILITTLIFLGSFYFKAFGQVNQFPYLESFENETFTEGTNVYFITNWFGNFVDGIRIFNENVNVKSGTHALGLWPIVEEGEDEEEVEVFAQVDLDLTGLENVVSSFWVATVATGAMKHVKLYMMMSIDGGLTFGPRFIMGTDHRGFGNMNTPYKEFIFALHPDAFDNPNVVLRFLAKAGAKSGYPAKILIDDVSFYAAPEDIFPPLAVDPSIANVNQIDIQFSEPVGESALNPANYTFLNASPLVGYIELIKSDLIRLNLSVPIQIGKYYDLLLSNISDLVGNTMLTTTFTIIHNPLTEGLVISEIMYDEPPIGQNDNLEFIEIYNVTDEPIELGGLMIKGGITSGKLPEYTLQSDSYWVTAKNALAVSGFFGVYAYQWHGANLSNDEPETIFIVNTNHHSGVKIDSLTYRTGAPWPEGAAGLGYSMELIDPLADNSDPSNWKNSSNFFGIYNGYDIYATPGAPNSTLGNDDYLFKKAIRLYPNPVSDHLTIDSDIQLKKVEIYSMFGKKVKDINSGFRSISIHTLSQGMYIVKIYFGNSFMYKKIIKD
ncbi:MAG: hypothetical protein DA407_12625 [Bacteroidetes bacterium]|nr:MAG: hypothetical protein DA407_12625 [Bacteroidota bacterium]